MKTHNAIIYHCAACGRVLHAEFEAKPPECCGHTMAKSCEETVHEWDVAGKGASGDTHPAPAIGVTIRYPLDVFPDTKGLSEFRNLCQRCGGSVASGEVEASFFEDMGDARVDRFEFGCPHPGAAFAFIVAVKRHFDGISNRAQDSFNDPNGIHRTLHDYHLTLDLHGLSFEAKASFSF